MTRAEVCRFLESIYFRSRPGLSCEGCFRYLSLYAEGRLSGRRYPRSEQVRSHLIWCPFCRDVYDGLREALGEAPREA